MNKTNKKIGVVLILLIPIFFYLILNQFGRNHFELAYYGPKTLRGEDTVYYSLNEQQLGLKVHEITVVAFFDSSHKSQIDKINQLNRLHEWYKEDPGVNYLFVEDDVKEIDWGFGKALRYDEKLMEALFPVRNTHDLFIEHEHVSWFDVFILLDKSGRIRGYYEGALTEEVNRLKEEISILINNGE